MPIELLNFSGFNAGNTNILNWKTETESNFDYFDVTRSSDNHTFTSIGIVQGKGVNGNGADYTFTDALPKQGVNYYQLQLVDIDGKTARSNAIEILVDGHLQYYVFPNPAQDLLNITLSGFGAKAKWEIYNMLGQLVQSKDIDPKNGNTFSMDVSNLAKGVYQYQVKYQGDVYLGKFVKE